MPDTGESTTDRRERLSAARDDIAGADSKNSLIGAIRKALEVSAPVGDPDILETLGTTYRKQADQAEKVHDEVESVARSGLPEVWVGDTGARAADVVAAAFRDAEQMAVAFRAVGGALMTLSTAVESARAEDRGGREQLREALTILGDEDGFFDDLVEKDAEEAERRRAQSVAGAGAERLHAAAVTADDAARAAARELDKYAAEARAARMDTGELSAADRLALADTGVAGGDREHNEILTATDLDRAGQRMDRMSPADRARFEGMLADASTPEERAYLTKAMAAGYDVDEVAAFRDKIHGRDPVWLQRHLTPYVTRDDSLADEGRNPDGSNVNSDQADFNGERWSQEGPTCVPSSVVTGRAMVDPVYALELTGGPSGQEEDTGAFRERLRDEQSRLYEEGDGGYAYDFPFGRERTGMDLEGQTEIADKEISPHTGSEYHQQDVRSADARRDVLPDIERSVAEGKPVPVNIEGKDEHGDRVGHAVMIVGQEGDMLQVYNPWGHTTWISEDDFVDGRMDRTADNRMPDAYSVHLPAE